VLGDCLLALADGGDEVDRRAGAIVLGEFVNLVRGALRKR
jgi:hypothetical protein